MPPAAHRTFGQWTDGAGMLDCGTMMAVIFRATGCV